MKQQAHEVSFALWTNLVKTIFIQKTPLYPLRSHSRHKMSSLTLPSHIAGFLGHGTCP